MIELEKAFELYKTASKPEWKLCLSMFFPKRERKQAILNMVYTAKRMGFKPHCIAKVLSKIYLITIRQAFKYVKSTT